MHSGLQASTSTSHACPHAVSFRLYQRKCPAAESLSSRRRSAYSTQMSHPYPRYTTAVRAAAPALEAAPDLDLAKMEPLGDRVLVKPEEESSTTESGLLVSSQSSGSSMGLQDAVIGEVIAVGKDVDIAVKTGDRVLFTKYSTSDISVPDGDVTFVAQKSILATLS